jgi:signal transduction histidine kinase
VTIRARLALAFAALAALLLVSVGAAVYVVERRDVGVRLRSEARQAASAALSGTADSDETGGGDGDGDESDHHPEVETLDRYLADRVEAAELLLVLDVDGVRHANRDDARALGGADGTRAINGRDFVVAQATAGDRTAYAAVPRAADDERLESLLWTLVEIGAAGLAATVLLAWLAARRTLRPLGRIADRAALITAGDLGARVGDPGSHDEVAEVAVAIDAMLERLELAFAGQRRFVNDASHELRTPLTIARGHLEVLVLDPDPDPAEVRRTVELAVSELDRMGKLTDGLLRLARAAEGMPARTEPVHLAEIAASAIERSRALGGERRLALAVPPAELLVVLWYDVEFEGLMLYVL